jgi:hypothetical protein
MYKALKLLAWSFCTVNNLTHIVVNDFSGVAHLEGLGNEIYFKYTLCTACTGSSYLRTQ